MRRYLTIIIYLLSLSSCSLLYGAPVLETLNDLSTEELYAKGEDYFSRNIPDSATLVFTIITTREKDGLSGKDLDMCVQTRNYLGVINFNASNYAAAYTHFLRSVQLYDVPNAPGYHNLAALYLYFGDKPRAFRCLRNVLTSSVEGGNTYHASMGLLNILMADFNASEIPVDSVAPLIEMFRKLPRDSRDDKAYIVADILSKAYLESNAGRHDGALEYLRASLGNMGRMVLPARDIHSVYMMMAREFRSVNSPDSTLLYLEKAENLAKQNGFKELLAETLLEKSDLYRVSGKHASADALRLRAYEIRDSLFNPRELGRLRDLQQAYETEHLQRDLESIRAEERYRHAIAWILGISLLILAVFTIILLKKNHELKGKTKALFLKNLPDKNSVLAAVDTEDPCSGEELPESSAAEDVPSSGGESLTEREEGAATSPDNVSSIAPNIPEATKRRILTGIANAFTDEAVFTDSAFSLQSLAGICGSNTRYVSQVINERFGKSFPQMLNERRIELAKQYLSETDDSHSLLTIEGIGQSVGYKSRSTFSKTFKAVTGLTPDEYKKMAREHGSRPA